MAKQKLKKRKRNQPGQPKRPQHNDFKIPNSPPNRTHRGTEEPVTAVLQNSAIFSKPIAASPTMQNNVAPKAYGFDRLASQRGFLHKWGRRALLILFPTTLSIFSFLIALYPKINVQPGAPLTPSEMFSAPFAVTYDAPVPIKSVTLSCVLANVKTQPNIVFEGIRTQYQSAHVPWMFWGDTETVYCGFPLPSIGPFGPVALDATIYISTEGYPFGLPFIHRWKLSRFQSVRQSDGGFRWIPKAPLWGWGKQPSPESLGTFLLQDR